MPNRNVPSRKNSLRLADFDYSQSACYFVTVCTKDRQPLLGTICIGTECPKSAICAQKDEQADACNIAYPYVVDDDGLLVPMTFEESTVSVGVDAHIDPHLRLSNYGIVVQRYIRSVPGIRAYVIMPNHVHLLVEISDADGSMWASTPTTGNEPSGGKKQPLGTRIRSFKTLSSKEVGFSLWQRSYYDHVVRDEAEALRILQYIQTNPARWAEDKYYQKQEESPCLKECIPFPFAI